VQPRFFIAEALRSVRSNLALAGAATVTVLIAVFVMGAFISSFLYVQSAVDSQKEKIDVSFWISDAATVDQVNGLQTQLEALEADGTVESFTYVSKDDALAKMRERLRDPSILDELTSNPFPASYEVKPSDPEQSQLVIDAVGEDHPALDPDQPVSFGQETADRLIRIANFVKWSGLGLVIVLGLASILLIGNTIRLSIFARRREVEVMKLVGATNWFIRWPFVIEGVICGLIGALLSIGLLYATWKGVVAPFVDRSDSELTREESGTIGFFWLSLILVAAGALLGAVGSGITLRRFLKV
jgi:cell division transport system permease protein